MLEDSLRVCEITILIICINNMLIVKNIKHVQTFLASKWLEA